MCCRISVAETVVIPTNQETIVPGKLPMRGKVTPRRFADSDNGILVGRVFAIPHKKLYSNMGPFNVQPETSVLHKGTHIAFFLTGRSSRK